MAAIEMKPPASSAAPDRAISRARRHAAQRPSPAVGWSLIGYVDAVRMVRGLGSSLVTGCLTTVRPTRACGLWSWHPISAGTRLHLRRRPGLRCDTLACVPRAFQQVDVFTTTPYLGNPVVVVLRTGRATAPYVASQGTVLGREGRVHVSQDADGTIWVGGGTITCVSGQVTL